ncbi:aminodeoxychorismate synthase component I [Dyadobacter fanqingshengii]|uniref:Aminodeoxychorismate synthase component I n=1 Tax=Dyadobacter fanqingshengii TaxID=2906443 RepID=A0A9X1TBM7_9BACT|nr:aminodeoxychorismate synthase component I [Dyadobacter fanqingshengii]MCF0042169.1 aminodeoxychorismate synthase component I [Dyadobacter fanqingshengii]USJ35299.1 aminodeoxychorismate synthase component I [Dyadobacter fanqingshengii]
MEDPKRNFAQKLNAWGKSKTPFVFLVDYRIEKPQAWTLDDDNLNEIRFDLNGFRSIDKDEVKSPLPEFQFYKFPVPFEAYEAKFNHVVRNLKAGNSFLVNLSVPTDITTNLSLEEIFGHSEAPYRFLYKNEFVCFSPEIFIKIKGNRISSFPMKGTIDASVPDAENVILADSKEAAEHATIVDLIRNDLSMVAEKVWVEKYRYIDRIQTSDKTLLQVSSEIAGILPDDFEGKFGDLLLQMLPAGSITGAPKPSTLQIIEAAEKYERGFYTGVMGYFDGENFESAVMIRFIENQNGNFVFKSGGGITAQSNAQNEYQELIDKVYLPFAHVPHIMF